VLLAGQRDQVFQLTKLHDPYIRTIGPGLARAD
jgi:hypothetical protein